jgi:hypothetical protein
MNVETTKKPLKSRVLGLNKPKVKSNKFIKESILVEQELMSYHEYETRWYRPRTI